MTPTPDTTARTETAETVTVPREPTEEMCIAGEEAYWSAPKDEDRCTAMAASYRAMLAAAQAAAPTPHALPDRLRGMLNMAVASEDSFNRLSPAGRRLIQEAEGFFASSREDRDDLNACWDALQAETKRADAAEARIAALASPQHPVGVREAPQHTADDGLRVLRSIANQLGQEDDKDSEKCILECVEIIKEWNRWAALSHPPAQDAPGAASGSRFTIEHDGFTGTVIGHYERLDGKRGVVMQQDGTKVVHVYGEKWLKPRTSLDPSPPLPEADGEVVAELRAAFERYDQRPDYNVTQRVIAAARACQSALVSALRERDEARAQIRANIAAIERATNYVESARRREREMATEKDAAEAAREKAEQVAAGLREEGQARERATDEAIAHVRRHFPGAADEFEAAFERAALRASTQEGKTATPSVKDEEAGRG